MGVALDRLAPRDLLDLLEFWLIEPFDAALHAGRLSPEDHAEFVGAILDVLWPARSAGKAIELPDGRIAVAPSWWDEDDYERGVALPDNPVTADPVAGARSAVESAWTVLRGEGRTET